MKYVVEWSTDYCEEYDRIGYVIVEANSKEEAERRAVIPMHSVIDYVEEDKEIK